MTDRLVIAKDDVTGAPVGVLILAGATLAMHCVGDLDACLTSRPESDFDRQANRAEIGSLPEACAEHSPRTGG